MIKRLISSMVICSILPAILLFSGCGDSQDQGTTPAQDQSSSAASKTASQTAAVGTNASAGNPASGGAGDCSVVNGEQAASALGGTFIGSKEIADPPPNQVHCTLNVKIAGAEKVFVIWQMPAEDYDELKSFEEDPVTDVSGVGDKAFITFHPDNMRYDMAAAKAGKFLIEVTGDDEAQVKQLVSFIISQY